MIAHSKIIRYLAKCSDDIGAGKSKTAKHRQKHTLRVRLRRFIKTEIE